MIKQLLIVAGFLSCSFIFSQNVNIPDANFKSYLIGNSDINTNGDGEIQVSEANNFTGSIDCPLLNITDLTGIEYFTKISQLICNDNNLTTLDTSKNIALTSLECGNNQLVSLVISPSETLSVINCYNNQLSNIDVSKNIALETFDCSNNKLISLDVSKNTALLFLGCYNNQIKNLDLSKNSALTELLCSNNKLISLNVKNGNNANFNSFSSLQNSNLNCIQVDNVAYSNTNWTERDSWSNYNTDCGYMSAKDVKKSLLRIYPNPVKNFLNIETEEQFQSLEIYNSNGQLIKSSMLKKNDVSDLEIGNYIIKIKTNKGIYKHKVIKQ
jgi:hypothetical protein